MTKYLWKTPAAPASENVSAVTQGLVPWMRSVITSVHAMAIPADGLYDRHKAFVSGVWNDTDAPARTV